MIGHLETNPITKKPETASHLAEQFSWVPLPYSSPPGCPFPIKSLALSARVSSDNSFPSVRQDPSLGPWKGSPFLQQAHQALFPWDTPGKNTGVDCHAFLQKHKVGILQKYMFKNRASQVAQW